MNTGLMVLAFVGMIASSVIYIISDREQFYGGLVVVFVTTMVMSLVL